MTRPTIGSLCTGVGGLDLACEQFYGATPVWHAEIEPGPCLVLERHWPGVPNLGDLTAVDWSRVERVDILTAGYPCQPFSHAGKRKGPKDARHLWPHIIDAVRVLRPSYVVLENVRGHLSLGFDAVLGSLAEAGFDAEWCVLRASDVGACHQRARLFVVARDADRARADALAPARPPRDATGEPDLDAADAHGRRLEVSGQQDRWPQQPGLEAPRRGDADGRHPPAPDSGGERHGGGQVPGAVGQLDRGDEGEARQRQRPWEVPGDRSGEALLRTPSTLTCYAPLAHPNGLAGPTPIAVRGGPEAVGEPGAIEGAERLHRVAWGQYAPAIARWEHVLGRAAPAPTDAAGRLSPAFVTWMMGYPQGWVDGLTRTQALKALGNAVVPQQGLAALCELAPVVTPLEGT